MNGVLVVDKPCGPTSHTVVARVRRALGLRRIGHTGTLDPLATGVLPLVLGRATRLSSLLTGAVKEYVAGIRFGATTPTYDAEGRVDIEPASGTAVPLAPPPEPPGLTRERIESTLRNFRGAFDQAPPAFSARKTGGVPAYRRARRNQPVETRPVAVVVHALTLVDYAGGLATVHLTVSAGFYVRSLAHDLGARLGCGAYLESLRRTRAGDFSLDQAVPLDQIEAEGAAAAVHVIPLERLLPDIPSVVLTARGFRRASHGNDLQAEDFRPAPDGRGPAHEPRTTPAGARWRLMDEAGSLVGLAEVRQDGALHPVVVLM